MRHKDILHILANTTDGVFAVGTDHKIVFWNKAAQETLGYSAKEVLGKYCSEIIAGTDNNNNPVCSKSCSVMKSIEQGENPTNCEILTQSKTGLPTWLNVSTICIRGSQPELSTVVHMFRDITKKKLDISLIIDIASRISTANILDDNHVAESKSIKVKALTPRERVVLKYLGEGYRPVEISDKFYISLSTLRKHIQNIYNKLEVHSMLEAVTKARQNNLI